MAKWMWWGIALSVGGLFYHASLPGPLWPASPVERAHGLIVAPDAPRQKLIEHAPTHPYGDLTLQPLAEFDFDVRLISLAWYAFGEDARYSPVDLGIAWGQMSDSANLEALEWSHGSRYLNYRYSSHPPIPQRDIDRSIANLHVLPAGPHVLRQIEALRPGERIVGRGQLVSATRADGWRWTSSLTRDDTGAGACELILLSDVYRASDSGGGTNRN